MNHQTPKSKYAIAQINIPIEIFPDGEWTNHNDRITIQISETPELPPISNIENQQLLETIQQILGGSQDPEDEPPTRISLKLDDDDDKPPPFTIQIREPESTEIHVSTQEEEGEYGEEEVEEEDPPQPKTYYINPRELLLRKHRKPSKNNTFKLAPHPRANKTRSNRWVLMKDTKASEY